MGGASDLLDVGLAQTRILDRLRPLPAERVRLRHALGRVLAEDIYAPEDLPPLSSSSMDGYAVRAAAVALGTPTS